MTKRSSAFLLTFVGFVLLVAIFANSDFFSRHILGYSSKSLGREIATNDFTINWGWPVTKFEANNVKISNFSTGTDPTMLSVDHALISINFYSMLKGTLALPQVILDKPVLLLEKDKDGNANWKLTQNIVAGSTLEAVQPDDRTDFPVINQLQINEGKILYKDPIKETEITFIADTIEGEASSKANLKFSGKGKYQNHDFTIAIDGGNVFQLKDTNDPYPLTVDLQAGTTKASLKGTVLDPFQLKGLDISLSLKGQDAAELFTLIGMALPPTPPYDVTGHLNYEQDKWNFQDFKGRLGDSDLQGNVTWDTERERPLLSGEFISNNLDFDDLGGFIGATPSTKRGETASLKQKQKAAAKEESPYIIPDTPLDISRLKAMDAHVTFTGKKLISQTLPLDDFFMKVDLEDSLLELQPVRFGTAKGDISAYLTVNAREEPVKIKGDFKFTKLSLKPIFEKLAEKFGTKNVTDGYIGGTAQLEGTGKSLRQMLSTSYGTMGVGMEGGQLSNLVVELLGLDVAQSLGFLLNGDKPVPIRCMIGDFSVKNGLMDVRRFVIDTTDSNIQGKGNINLKNEQLNMTLNTYPKDSTLLSLNSPIRMTGTLKKPDVNLNVANIAGRGAAAAAVGALVFPVVGLIAFIEPGLGKDSNCAKLVADMDKHTGQTGNADMIPKNKTPKIKK